MTAKLKTKETTDSSDNFILTVSLSGVSKGLELKVKKIESTPVSAKYNFEAGEEVIKKVVDSKLQELTKTVKIGGFRPGKVPLNIIESKYKQSVMRDTLQIIIDRATPEFLKQSNLKLATRPNVEVVSFDEKNLKYNLDFEIFPEIDIPDFGKIKLEKPMFKISEEEIEKNLSLIAQSRKSFEPAAKTYKAKIGDTVLIDFEGKIAGKLFDGGAAKDFKLELGKKNFIDDFEEQLVGTKAGDSKLVKVTFPQNYHAKDFAGKPAEFSVEVKEVLKGEAPKVDDEFAKKLGMNDLKDLKETLTRNLEQDYNKLVQTKIRKELFDKLDEICKFPLPPTSLKEEFDVLWKKVNEMKNTDPSMQNKKESELKKEYELLASRRVKLGLLLAEIGKNNEFEINNEDVQNAVLEQALNYPGQEQIILDYYKKNPAAVNSLRGPILEEKAVKHILEFVKFSEKLYSIEKLKESTVFE